MSDIYFSTKRCKSLLSTEISKHKTTNLTRRFLWPAVKNMVPRYFTNFNSGQVAGRLQSTCAVTLLHIKAIYVMRSRGISWKSNM